MNSSPRDGPVTVLRFPSDVWVKDEQRMAPFTSIIKPAVSVAWFTATPPPNLFRARSVPVASEEVLEWMEEQPETAAAVTSMRELLPDELWTYPASLALVTSGALGGVPKKVNPPDG